MLAKVWDGRTSCCDTDTLESGVKYPEKWNMHSASAPAVSLLDGYPDESVQSFLYECLELLLSELHSITVNSIYNNTNIPYQVHTISKLQHVPVTE